MTLLIRDIEAKETHLIRHKVLWPDFPLEKCILKEDERAQHYGAFIEGNLIGVLSLFPDTDLSVRLRKFAIMPRFQGKGIGLAMLQFVLKELMNSKTQTLWCDARSNALNFYQKLGFETEGDEFFKEHVSYYKMVCTLNFMK